MQKRAGRLRFYALRLGICVAILLGYFMVLRPARILTTEHVVYPQVQYLGSNPNTANYVFKGGSLNISYSFFTDQKKVQYRPEFGFFFLVSLLVLVFVSNKKKNYQQLILLHLAASVFAYLFLMMGMLGMSVGFIFADAIGAYLTPALSLAIVPLVIANKI